MAYTLYGAQLSRASRVTWVLRELGLDFQHVSERAPLSINPNNKIPSLHVERPGSTPFTLYESFAITQYLAKKHSPGSIGPASAEEDAKIAQWSLWAITETEMPMLSILMKQGDAAEHRDKLTRPLQALDDELRRSGPYLVGGRFTVADINVASILVAWGRAAKFDFSAFPHVAAYSDLILKRPKFRPPRLKKAKL